MKTILQATFFLLFSGILQIASVQDSLRPLMNVPSEVVYQTNFNVPGDIDKTEWQERQGTRWKIVDGVLRGEQSSAEYQAKKADHKGFDPRIKSLKTPDQFIAKFSVRFIGGEETSLLPIVEFGHHNVRLKFSDTGVSLMADHESIMLAKTESLKLELGRWYHVMAEKSRDEFIVQFADGPTLYAKHSSIAIPVADESDGLGIAGTRRGVVEIDTVTIASIKLNETAKNWDTTQAKLLAAATEPVEIRKKEKANRDRKARNRQAKTQTEKPAMPNKGSVQTIAPDDSNIAYRGILYPNIKSTAVELLRLPASVFDEAKPQTHGFNPEKGRVPAGGSIAISTDSPTVTLKFDATKPMKFGVYQNGEFTGVAKLAKNGALTIESVTPGKVINYRIGFPNFHNPIFTGLVIDAKSSLQPATAPREKIYVAIGDSITHGRGQDTSHETWGWHVAEALEMEFYNLAIGGSNANSYQPAAIAALPKVDLVTILWGYNDWVNNGKTVEKHTQDMNAAIDIIRDKHPETPIAVLRMLQTTTTLSKRTKDQFSAGDFRKAVDDLVAKRRATGDTNIHVIDSDTLTTAEDLKDSVHLTVEGAVKFGKAMSEILKPLLK